MLGRAELFFVVLNSAYLENTIFSEEMFFSLTMAAMMLNISVPITISLYKPYYMAHSNSTNHEIAHATTLALVKIAYSKATKDQQSLERRIFNGKAHAEDDLQIIVEKRTSSKG